MDLVLIGWVGLKVNGLDLGNEFDPKFTGLKYVGL